jgi:hypothetical protein
MCMWLLIVFEMALVSISFNSSNSHCVVLLQSEHSSVCYRRRGPRSPHDQHDSCPPQPEGLMSGRDAAAWTHPRRAWSICHLGREGLGILRQATAHCSSSLRHPSTLNVFCLLGVTLSASFSACLEWHFLHRMASNGRSSGHWLCAFLCHLFFTWVLSLGDGNTNFFATKNEHRVQPLNTV